MAQHATPCPTVLLVEDDEDTRSMLKRMLGMLGYYVVEAADGHEAIGLAIRRCPDLIIMDIGLPVVDGFSAGRGGAPAQAADLRAVPGDGARS